MEKRNKCVYKHINKDTNEIFYIGRGKYSRPNDKLNRNIDWNKYISINNWHSEIIEKELTEEEASKLETKLILEIGRTCDNTGSLLNKKINDSGKSGFKLSEETKEKISKANLGSKRTEAAKEKMSKTRLGTPAWNKGLIDGYSDETRLKMSNSRMGIKLSEETKKKMSEGSKGEGNNMYGKRGINAPGFKYYVLVYKDGEFVGKYEGCGDAGRQLGVLPNSITRILCGRRKSAKGYTFKKELI